MHEDKFLYNPRIPEWRAREPALAVALMSQVLVIVRA